MRKANSLSLELASPRGHEGPEAIAAIGYPADMDGPTQTAKEHKEPSDMDGSTKTKTKELKTDSTVEELKNGSPVRRSLALFLGIFALFSLGGSAARVVAARADATTLRLHAVPDFELIDVLTLPTNPRLFARLFNSAHLHGLPSDGAPTTLPVDFRPEPAAISRSSAAVRRRAFFLAAFAARWKACVPTAPTSVCEPSYDLGIDIS